MARYRIKLLDGKIVGPFDADQVGVLFQKGHLSKTELAQVYPQGLWKIITSYQELKEIFVTIESVGTMTNPTAKEEKNKFPKSFDYNEPSLNLPQFNLEPLQKEKTKIDQILQEENITEKTKVLSPHAQTDYPDHTFIKEDPTQPPSLDTIQDAIAEDISQDVSQNISEDKTHMFQLDEMKESVEKNTKPTEIAWENFSNEAKKKNAEKKGIKKKPKLLIIVITIVLLAIFFFYPTEDKKNTDEFKITYPQIIFPTPYTEMDEAKSQDLYKKGLEAYGEGTYLSKIKSADLFRQSLENKFQENKALGKLILVYSELLPHDKKETESGTAIFKLIEIAKIRSLSDIYIVIGMANFYHQLGKVNAAIHIIENFLRLEPATAVLLSLYLDLVLNKGDLVKAKEIFNKLKSIPKLPKQAYLSLAHYYQATGNESEIGNLLEEGIKNYPVAVDLLLEKAKWYIAQEDFLKTKECLLNIRKLKAEESSFFYAKYLEYWGIYYASIDNIKLATSYFKRALSYKESPELRSKLALLDIPNKGEAVKVVSALILESKIIDLMKRAKLSAEDKKWQQAFVYAIEASDLSMEYLPSKILLAQIQVKQGYFEQAINMLKELQKSRDLEPSIHYALAESYTESYKFDEATKELQFLSNTGYRSTYEYALAWGKLYTKSGNFLQAVVWLQRCVARNPLSDEGFYLLGKNFLKFRKYDKARQILGKAIALDPGNLTYRVDYAKIIYEHEDNPEAAIGFLREILKDYPDHPQVLGAIAIYYRRSGQLKYFEDTKKEIMNLPNKDTTFYTFMMEAAQLDENTDLVISYGRELLKLEQGNLNVRMQVAKTLYEKGDLQQALLELEEIKRKLPSYPRLYYYLSKIYSVQGKIDLSLEMAKKEVESNPTLEYGHIQLGNIYTQKEQFSEAQNAFETAQKINGKSVEALMGLAWIKYRQNHVESALDLYTKAAQLDQGNPLVHKQLGFVYKAIGQHILAVQEFKTYLDLSPNADDRAKIQSYIDLLQ